MVFWKEMRWVSLEASGKNGQQKLVQIKSCFTEGLAIFYELAFDVMHLFYYYSICYYILLLLYIYHNYSIYYSSEGKHFFWNILKWQKKSVAALNPLTVQNQALISVEKQENKSSAI